MGGGVFLSKRPCPSGVEWWIRIISIRESFREKVSSADPVYGLQSRIPTHRSKLSFKSSNHPATVSRKTGDTVLPPTLL